MVRADDEPLSRLSKSMKSSLDKFEGQFRGEGPLGREQWFGICSAHREPRPDCPSCMTGHYVNIAAHRVETCFYKICPWLWRIWVNRKNSPSRRRLEESFPQLKRK